MLSKDVLVISLLFQACAFVLWDIFLRRIGKVASREGLVIFALGRTKKNVTWLLKIPHAYLDSASVFWASIIIYWEPDVCYVS